MAGIVYTLKDKLIEFLKKYSTAQHLRHAVLQDLQNSNIILQLKLLEFLEKS